MLPTLDYVFFQGPTTWNVNFETHRDIDSLWLSLCWSFYQYFIPPAHPSVKLSIRSEEVCFLRAEASSLLKAAQSIHLGLAPRDADRAIKGRRFNHESNSLSQTEVLCNQRRDYSRFKRRVLIRRSETISFSRQTIPFHRRLLDQLEFRLAGTLTAMTRTVVIAKTRNRRSDTSFQKSMATKRRGKTASSS